MSYLKHVKKSQPHIGKFVVSFLDKWGYCLTVHWNLTGGSILKVSCNVDSELTAITFYILLKIHWSIMNFGWIFYLCMILYHASLIWKILLHLVTQILQMFIYFLIQFFFFLNHVKSLNIGRCQVNGGRHVFQNSSFGLKAQILSLSSNTACHFPWSYRLISFTFEKMLPSPVLNNHSFPVNNSFK